ncbi:unnamed protein product [Ceratitis capitata]|uniref:(Mediterranean fruit fly) hypothetical protein n=1 Tax=Ceratitis capitata TaxID=7213 RepID=A0A811UB72_CERCA|nr:unnamed protein product [Ceratitis capitata]
MRRSLKSHRSTIVYDIEGFTTETAIAISQIDLAALRALDVARLCTSSLWRSLNCTRTKSSFSTVVVLVDLPTCRLAVRYYAAPSSKQVPSVRVPLTLLRLWMDAMPSSRVVASRLYCRGVTVYDYDSV